MKTLSAFLIVMLSFVSFAGDVVPVKNVKDSVNIRLGPDAGSDVVGRLRQGESLPLVNALPGWYEVKLEGDATGYISADWALVTEEGTDETVEETADADVGGAAGPIVGDAPVDIEEVVTDAAERVDDDGPQVVEEHDVEEPVEDDFADATESIAEEVINVELAEEAADDRILAGPPGPRGIPGAANIKGSKNFLVKFRDETVGGNSQIFDNGNMIGIGTTEPKQRLEVNGSIQIHEQNSSVAGLMITQSSGDTGYIMHNRASTLTIGAGSQDRITIDREGNVGVGVPRPSYPLEMASGAHVTVGGVWTNSSSRAMKENIATLSDEQASLALMQLKPVLFNYRDEREEQYVGFIAEDVPELVANRHRDALSAMDIVAVLTKVLQSQQQKIDALEARLDAQQAEY